MGLGEYVRMLRTHAIVIVALALLGAAVGVVSSAVQRPVYTADASGHIAAVAPDGSLSDALSSDRVALSKVSAYVDIASGRAVAEHAIDELGLSTTPEDLVARVRVTNPSETVIVRVAADAASPAAARDLAEAWVRGLAAEMERIESADGRAVPAVRLRTGDSARLPTEPSSPNTRLNVVAGVFGGLAVAVVYAAARRRFDRRLRSPEEVEAQVEASVIGTLPLVDELTGERRVHAFVDTAGQRASPHAEAVRELRTNLQYVRVDEPPRVIVVTSPLPGDGKSTTAANLAASIAATGQKAVLIDADLRRPVVASLFGLGDDVGLSEVLSGRVGIDDVARVADDHGDLLVVPAGRTPPNPSELLGSARMRALVASLSARMIVVIDSPPTIPVADAAILSTFADGVVVVITAGRTSADLLQKAVANIARANGSVLGVVLNRLPRRQSSSYGGYARPPAARPTRVRAGG